ncbi:MAG TPA: hypothetical protein PLP25_00125 [Candidatus Limiplasma sp.]|nr:hypothetical protein [Candidatus Limiplasma sp.]
MNNCRRMTRRERREIAAIMNGIKETSLTHNDPHILAYGRPPYPLREPAARRQPVQRLPGKVTAWLNSPAANQTELDRIMNRISPILMVSMLVIGAVYLTLAWVISLR